MKEAAGEANLTVVAIILIAVVVAVATPIIRSLMKTSAYRACCTDAGLIWEGSDCKYPASDGDNWVNTNRSEEFWECTDKSHLSRRRILVQK